MKYYDVHVFITRGTGYSIPVEMDPYKNYSDDEVIEFAAENQLFTEEGDEKYVDTVTRIDKDEFNQMKGIPNG